MGGATRYVYFKIRPAGLSNQRVALDNAVAIAHLTGRCLVHHGARLSISADAWEDRGRPARRPRESFPRRLAPAPGAVRVAARTQPELAAPSILDLFEVPVPVLNEADFLAEYPSLDRARIDQHLTESVFFFPGDLSLDTEDFRMFANGRTSVLTADERSAEAGVLELFGNTLAMYSYLFYSTPAGRAGLVELMSRIRPRVVYSLFADRLARELGRFHAIHVRRGTQEELRSIGKWFRDWAPRGRAPAEEIAANLLEIIPRDEPLVILTDDAKGGAYFEPLLRAFPRALMLDRFLAEDPRWSRELRELPFAGRTVLALVAQLVACRAATFAGTSHSTFTSVIQRMRGFAGDPRFYFLYSQFSGGPEFAGCRFVEDRAGPYSWNRCRYPLGPGEHAWFREWPEAFEVTGS